MRYRRFGFPVFRPFTFGGTLRVLGGPFLRDLFLGNFGGAFTFRIGHHFGDVRAVASFFGHHHAPVRRVHAQLPPTLRRGEQLLRHLQRQLVGGHAVRQVGPLVLWFAVLIDAHHTLQVRAVPPHAHHDASPFGIVEQVQGVDQPGVDMLQVIAHQGFQTAQSGHGFGGPVGGISIAEIKSGEPVGAVFIAGGNIVELVLHGGGEVVVH